MRHAHVMFSLNYDRSKYDIEVLFSIDITGSNVFPNTAVQTSCVRISFGNLLHLAAGQTGAHATDPSNTTVFVGGINDSVTEKVLRDTFACAGEIQQVTTPPGRGCAFVTFTHRVSAEHVINNMQGITICGSCVRLSWGKSGRADRERERTADAHGGLPGVGTGMIQSSPTAAAAAAAARGANFSGLYGHPPSYAAYGGNYPANLFSGTGMYGTGYAPTQQTAGLQTATPPPTQLSQQQHQQQVQQVQQQQVHQQQQQQVQQQAPQQQPQQYAQHYSPHSFAPFQGYGFQQFQGQAAAYTGFTAGNPAYSVRGLRPTGSATEALHFQC